jgi:hypothetical protein
MNVDNASRTGFEFESLDAEFDFIEWWWVQFDCWGCRTSVNKIVDIKFSAQDAFLETPSSGTIKAEILENQIIKNIPGML